MTTATCPTLRYRIYGRPFKHWSPKRQQELMKVCMGNQGCMASILELRPQHVYSFVAISQGTVIAHAILDYWEGTTPAFMVYVSPPHRRQGIGSRLYQKAMHHNHNFGVNPWDRVSRRFFDQMRMRHDHPIHYF